MTEAERLRAATLIAVDPIDVERAFRDLGRSGCARCGGPRDARGPRGGLLGCCAACLHKMKMYRVYGNADAEAPG